MDKSKCHDTSQKKPNVTFEKTTEPVQVCAPPNVKTVNLDMELLLQQIDDMRKSRECSCASKPPTQTASTSKGTVPVNLMFTTPGPQTKISKSLCSCCQKSADTLKNVPSSQKILLPEVTVDIGPEKTQTIQIDLKATSLQPQTSGIITIPVQLRFKKPCPARENKPCPTKSKSLASIPKFSQKLVYEACDYKEYFNEIYMDELKEEDRQKTIKKLKREIELAQKDIVIIDDPFQHATVDESSIKSAKTEEADSVKSQQSVCPEWDDLQSTTETIRSETTVQSQESKKVEIAEQKEPPWYEIIFSENYIEPYLIEGYSASTDNVEIQTDLALGSKLLSDSLNSVSVTSSQSAKSEKFCKCGKRDTSVRHYINWNKIFLSPKEETFEMTDAPGHLSSCRAGTGEEEPPLPEPETESLPPLVPIPERYSFIYSSFDYNSQNEAYVNALRTTFPDDEESLLPWNKLLLPDKIKIRKIQKLKLMKPAGCSVSAPCVCPPKDSKLCSCLSRTLTIPNFSKPGKATSCPYLQSRPAICCCPKKSKVSFCADFCSKPQETDKSSSKIVTCKYLNRNLTATDSQPETKTSSSSAIKKTDNCNQTCPEKFLAIPETPYIDIMRQDPVVAAFHACEAELKPVREALTQVKTKLKNLNMPELDCLFSKKDDFDNIPFFENQCKCTKNSRGRGNKSFRQYYKKPQTPSTKHRSGYVSGQPTPRSNKCRTPPRFDPKSAVKRSPGQQFQPPPAHRREASQHRCEASCPRQQSQLPAAHRREAPSHASSEASSRSGSPAQQRRGLSPECIRGRERRRAQETESTQSSQQGFRTLHPVRPGQETGSGFVTIAPDCRHGGPCHRQHQLPTETKNSEQGSGFHTLHPVRPVQETGSGFVTIAPDCRHGGPCHHQQFHSLPTETKNSEQGSGFQTLPPLPPVRPGQEAGFMTIPPDCRHGGPCHRQQFHSLPSETKNSEQGSGFHTLPPLPPVRPGQEAGSGFVTPDCRHGGPCHHQQFHSLPSETKNSEGSPPVRPAQEAGSGFVTPDCRHGGSCPHQQFQSLHSQNQTSAHSVPVPLPAAGLPRSEQIQWTLERQTEPRGPPRHEHGNTPVRRLDFGPEENTYTSRSSPGVRSEARPCENCPHMVEIPRGCDANCPYSGRNFVTPPNPNTCRSCPHCSSPGTPVAASTPIGRRQCSLGVPETKSTPGGGFLDSPIATSTPIGGRQCSFGAPVARSTPFGSSLGSPMATSTPFGGSQCSSGVPAARSIHSTPERRPLTPTNQNRNCDPTCPPAQNTPSRRNFTDTYSGTNDTSSTMQGTGSSTPWVPPIFGRAFSVQGATQNIPPYYLAREMTGGPCPLLRTTQLATDSNRTVPQFGSSGHTSQGQRSKPCSANLSRPGLSDDRRIGASSGYRTICPAERGLDPGELYSMSSATQSGSEFGTYPPQQPRDFYSIPPRTPSAEQFYDKGGFQIQLIPYDGQEIYERQPVCVADSSQSVKPTPSRRNKGIQKTGSLYKMRRKHKPCRRCPSSKSVSSMSSVSTCTMSSADNEDYFRPNCASTPIKSPKQKSRKRIKSQQVCKVESDCPFIEVIKSLFELDCSKLSSGQSMSIDKEMNKMRLHLRIRPSKSKKRK